MANDAYGFKDSKMKVYIADAIQEAISSVDFSDQINKALQKIYPAGSIYISTESANPATYLGFGTWVPFGPGRTIVCVNSSDTDFASANLMGGHKATEKHTHKFTSIFRLRDSITPGGNKNDDIWKGSDGTNFKHETITPSTGDVQATYYLEGVNKSGTAQESKITISGNAENFGTGNAGNLQPYITAYVWKRTA